MNLKKKRGDDELLREEEAGDGADGPDGNSRTNVMDTDIITAVWHLMRFNKSSSGCKCSCSAEDFSLSLREIFTFYMCVAASFL